ncbi:hypothetical protein FQR65_LT11645 [Abscondita terminalis]|nr:hypothetical protein FQR65_LT11645 [Abscondita terminalis]
MSSRSYSFLLDRSNITIIPKIESEQLLKAVLSKRSVIRLRPVVSVVHQGAPILSKGLRRRIQIVDVRIAALECLVDFVRADGRWSDLQHLLDIVENDPDPGVRHKLVRLLIEHPPFERAHRQRLDIPELVDRIWNNINGMLSHDTRLRCDLVDLYFILYGIRRPTCIPNPETENLYKPQRQNPPMESKRLKTFSSPTPPLPPVNVEMKKEGPTDIIIDDTLECVNVEIIAREEKIKEELLPLDLKIEPPVKTLKKKKRDKKKHKHKHKHKHDHKHNKDKDKKDKDLNKLKVKEETLSSVSSTPSPSSHSLGAEFL